MYAKFERVADLIGHSMKWFLFGTLALLAAGIVLASAVPAINGEFGPAFALFAIGGSMLIAMSWDYIRGPIRRFAETRSPAWVVRSVKSVYNAAAATGSALSKLGERIVVAIAWTIGIALAIAAVVALVAMMIYAVASLPSLPVPTLLTILIVSNVWLIWIVASRR